VFKNLLRTFLNTPYFHFMRRYTIRYSL
jgi:hypothetical protein